MPRYIIIDNNTGYIFGDTHNVNGKLAEAGDAIDACRVIDEGLGVYERRYEGVNFHRLATSTETGYHVYRAEAGAEDFPPVIDGQDRETIAAVERDCIYITSVLCLPAKEG